MLLMSDNGLTKNGGAEIRAIINEQLLRDNAFNVGKPLGLQMCLAADCLEASRV